MLDKKVKISSILDSQIPEFIQAESPLFKEFLQQYYISEEHEYGTSDLAGRIGDLKDIESFSRLTYAAVPVTVTQEVLDLDDVINVSSTAGFPNTYGLIKINSEELPILDGSAAPYVEVEEEDGSLVSRLP